MGTIDSTLHTLECPQCGVKESKKVLDKGSRWGGSYWQARADFEAFQTSWRGGANVETELVTAHCKACGGPASHSSAFGGM